MEIKPSRKMLSKIQQSRMPLSQNPTPNVTPTTNVQIILIGTLLIGKTKAWFVLLLETSSPLLRDCFAFEATFGEFDKHQTLVNKFYKLQGSKIALTDTSNFQQLNCNVTILQVMGYDTQFRYH